jgi:MFS family permease
MFATWCSRIPDIKTRFELNDGTLGLLLLLLPIGEFASIFPNGYCVTRFGSKRMALLAGFLYPTLLICLGLATSVTQLALLLLLTGAIANLSNTAVNTQGVHLEQTYGRSIMALFHGMWSIAGLFAVALATLLAFKNTPILTHFCGMALGAALLLCFSGGALANDTPPPQTPTKIDEKTQNKDIEPKADTEGAAMSGATDSEKQKTQTQSPLKAWKFTPAICWLGIACFGCMACEGTVYNWSSIYMKDVLHTTPQWQGLAYLAYMCTMVTGRFILDPIANRFGLFRILFICASAITLGFLLIVLAAILPLGAHPLTLIGFAIVGCGTSAVVPLCCGLTGRCKDIPSGIAIAQISTIGFFGLLLAPPLTGLLSKTIGLPLAFLTMALISLPVPLAIHRLTRLIAPQ